MELHHLQTILVVVLFTFMELGQSLRCLSCIGTLQPWMCNNVRICVGQDENCGIRKYRTVNREILYDMDCVTDKICQTNQGKRNAFINRSNGNEAGVLCQECCQGEFCNTRGCHSQDLPNDRGPICFKCRQITDPSKCGRLSFCRQDEMCAVYEEQIFGIKYFNSKCSPVFDCNIQPGVIGRRQSTIRQCGSCCNTDFCNINCQGANIPHPTEGAANQGTQTSNPMTNYTDADREFVLLYPFNDYFRNMYVFMTTTTQDVVLVDVPFLSMKKNITLFAGRNYVTFNSTMMTTDRGYVDHKGIYLKSSVPLSVSVMFDYIDDKGGNAITRNEYVQGYMALPVSRLGKKYVIAGYSYSYNQLFTIAAIHDDTSVSIQIPSGDVKINTMNRLDTLCMTYTSDRTGTTVFADKDIAVVSGDYYYHSAHTTMAQYMLPVSQWGTTFFIPSLPKMPGYEIFLQMGELGGNTTVNVTSTKGTHEYQFRYPQYVHFYIDSPPVYIESKKPIQLTVYTFANTSLSGTAFWIPSTNQYRNSYVVTNPNNVTSGSFNESLLVVIPVDEQNGLLLDGMPVHSIEVNPTLSVNSSSYAFMTIPLHGGYHMITHSDPSVKFGAFVFGEGRLLHRNGYSHYAFQAGIE